MNGSIALFFVIFVNLIVFLFGCAITGFSYLAYRGSGGNKSFRRSTVGFGLITLGCVAEPVFQFGIKRDWEISSQELLQLQAMEGTLIAVGLGFLFMSIYNYKQEEITEHTSTVGSETVTTRIEEAPSRSKGATYQSKNR